MNSRNLARLLALIHQKKMQKQRHRDRKNQPIIIFVNNDSEKYKSEEFDSENYLDWLAPYTDKKDIREVACLAEDCIEDMWEMNPEDYRYGDVVRILSYKGRIADIYWEAENPEEAYHFPNGEIQILAELGQW